MWPRPMALCALRMGPVPSLISTQDVLGLPCLPPLRSHGGQWAVLTGLVLWWRVGL